MSLGPNFAQRNIYIPGNNKQTHIYHNKAFECGLVSGFQQAILEDKNPVGDIVKLNLIPFFKKPTTI
jgi:hypothetical protein